MNDLEAARELLDTAKRNLQLVDAQLQTLSSGRQALALANDVSSEHRVAWFGAVDALDGNPGIDLGQNGLNNQFGMQNPHRGIIRTQEDAAFVCTNIMCAWRRANFSGADLTEDPQPIFSEDISFGSEVLALRMVDGNTGRTLTTGMSQGPLDLDRGIVDFGFLSSIRVGLGSNTKNKLFSEFTIPRASAVHVEVFKLGPLNGAQLAIPRAFVSLFGYKVYGA